MGVPGNFFDRRGKLSRREATALMEEALERARQALQAQPHGPERPALATVSHHARPAMAFARPSAWPLRLLRLYPEAAIIGVCLMACLLGALLHAA